MKHWFLAALLLASTAAFAKKKPKLSFDHVGKMTNHGPQMRYLLEGRTDLYEDDEYICTPGDEHNAPTCRTYDDWHTTEKFGYVEIQLDDSSTVVVTSEPAGFPERESWKHGDNVTVLRGKLGDWNNPLYKLAVDWEVWPLQQKPPNPLPDGATKTFRYAVDQLGNIYVNALDLINASP